MKPEANEASVWPELQRAHRTLVVIDVVESVRLMQANEADVVDRWRRFVDEVRSQVLPLHRGRLVKSLGDGLLLEFMEISPAVSAALDVQRRIGAHNRAQDPAAAMHLRAGVHVAEVVVDELDIYGSGVNLAARLASLADPGETVVSAHVRDALADGHDCHIVDLGECFLKHYPRSVRAFRVSSVDAGARYGLAPSMPLDDRPSLAVVPFAHRTPSEASTALGDAIADDVIAALSRSAGVTVISRLSTSALRDGRASLEETRALLGVAYVLTGTYRLQGSAVHVKAELCDARNGHVLWAEGLSSDVADIFSGQGQLVHTIATQVGQTVLRTEVHRARCLPIANLDGYTLYVASVFMLHRLGNGDFSRAKTLLEHLCQRYPRSAAPLAMLAKWHVLRIAQGWAPDALSAGREAQFCARRALALQPDHALALSLDAMMMAQLDGDLEQARASCEAAVEADPQEPHAWLSLGGIHTYLGNPEPAESLPMRAIELSPMDPARFLFDLFVAAGKRTAGKFDAAAQAARASIRLNAMHPSSYRLLTISLSLDGKMDEARKAGRDLMRVDPAFRVGAFGRRYAGRDGPHAAQDLKALLDAGVPA